MMLGNSLATRRDKSAGRNGGAGINAAINTVVKGLPELIAAVQNIRILIRSLDDRSRVTKAAIQAVITHVKASLAALIPPPQPFKN